MPKLPDSILNKIKCKNCKCWASCGPVRVLEDGGTACGRCRLCAPIDQYRHFAYEALACYFQFPCKYWEKHCHEALTFKDVIAHENECSYSPGCCFCCCHPITACRSNRKLDINAAIQLEIIPEQVLEYLRCSMCAGYLSSTPILVAKDGTSVCHRCTIQEGLIKNPEYRRHIGFEAFANMMIFPCVFRYEGCTNLYKFGDPMHLHETECLYNTNKNEPRKSQARIYGNVTANAALFALTTGKDLEKELFPEEFKKHKEMLATKWSQHQVEIALQEEQQKRLSRHLSFTPEDVITRPPLGRNESLSGNSEFHNTLISELKIKQSFRKHRLQSSDGSDSVLSSGSEQGFTPRRSQDGKVYRQT